MTICIPITAKNESQAIGQIDEANQLADNIELRLDFLPTCNLKKLLSHCKKPVIVTCRSKQEGGHFKGTEKERIRILRKAFETSADFVDIEYETLKKIGSTIKGAEKKVICSYHNFQKTPKNIQRLYQRMEKMPCAVVKLVTQATSLGDNCLIFSFLQKKKKKPVIAFCMGSQGVPSRILCCAYGSFLTFASLKEGTESAQGQISAKIMRKVYRIDKLTIKTKVYGIVGNPVLHSLSPMMHNTAFSAQNIDAVYLPFHVKNKRELARFLQQHKDWNIEGINVTYPYKISVVPSLAKVDETAKRIGAVNTISIRNGKLIGTNTDGIGVVDALRRYTTLKGKKIVILGAGGAARAATYALQNAEAKITILNRTKSKAQKIAKDFGCRGDALDALQTTDYDILMNATPVGMKKDASPVPIDALKKEKIVMDMIYSPRKTTLLSNAERKKCVVINGLEMLIQQGAHAFTLWTKKKFPVALIREDMEGELW